MKSYENIKRGAGPKEKEEKKENALDIISKSLKDKLSEAFGQGFNQVHKTDVNHNTFQL